MKFPRTLGAVLTSNEPNRPFVYTTMSLYAAVLIALSDLSDSAVPHFSLYP